MRSASAAVANYDGARLRADPGEAVEYIYKRHAPDLVEIGWDQLTRSEPREKQVTRQSPWGETVRSSVREVTFTVPASGSVALLQHKASTFAWGQSNVSIERDVLRFTYVAEVMTPEAATAFVEERKAEIDKAVAWLNADLTPWFLQLRQSLEGWVAARKTKLDEDAAFSEAFSVPLHAQAQEKRVPVPVQRTTVRIADRPTATPSPRESEAVLDQEIYEDVVRTIRAVANSFERLPRTASTLDEEGFRDLLLFVLNANYEGTARGEVFNGAGKTDILISHADRNVFIGELKIWSGEKNFAAAIDQLASYTVWRDTKAALIVLIKNQDASSVIDKADAALRAHDHFVSAPASNNPSRRDYVVSAKDDSVRQIRVALLPVVLRTEQEQQPAPESN